MTFHLESTAFGSGQPIPRKYIRDGENVSPPLRWSGAPRETKSYMLVCEDPDAPGGIFHHWSVFDIDPDCDHLNEATGRGSGHGMNDFGNIRYDGPQPPNGHGPHHYHFKLKALDIASLGLGDGSTISRIKERASNHILDEAELVGIFEAR